MLDKIGFIWDALEHEWNQKYIQFKAYIKQNGSANVPQSHPILGDWITVQRRQYKRGALTEERIKLLEIAGFKWDPFADEWNHRYQQLKKHIKDNGNANVPQRQSTLGSWVGTQRKARKKGKLSEDRIKLLDELGFVWDASNN